MIFFTEVFGKADHHILQVYEHAYCTCLRQLYVFIWYGIKVIIIRVNGNVIIF